MSSSSRRGGRAGLALLGSLLAAGCYHGSARSITVAELGDQPGPGSGAGWDRVLGVPEVRQAARADCGAAALAMVLGYWGTPGTPKEIAASSTPGPTPGIAAADLRNFARRQGLEAFVIEGRLDDLEREIGRRHPVVVGMMKRYAQRAYPHYEVVVGLDRSNQRVLTLDPAGGLRVNSREGFVSEWAAARQVALVVYPRSPRPSAPGVQ